MIRVVTGHICSGKSTYVREHSRPGDVIIDLDRIALSMAHESTAHHAYPDYIRETARAARSAAITIAMQQHRMDGLGNRDASFDVWIIHAYPTPEEERRYWMIDAQVVRIAADAQTLISRAKEQRPTGVVDELHRRLQAT
jgi:hypothetical protein